MERLDAEWVFGYGSLMWNPEFAHTEHQRAKLYGYHRAFCIHSTTYRGSTERPGVVLGLDRGGCVQGIAFRLEPASRTAAIDALYRREMLTPTVYTPRRVGVRLHDGRVVQALTFVANRASASYCRLPDDELLRRLLVAEGLRGPNIEYAVNTYAELERHGVHDAHLARVMRGLHRLAPHLRHDRATTALPQDVRPAGEPSPNRRTPPG
ncbi:MAG: gamma-glutamylcyclotransferase [Burkholderiales bacterium]|nr:MAG: gamma-glutamylcyclotransferase [Burkholderiales bacterium]